MTRFPHVLIPDVLKHVFRSGVPNGNVPRGLRIHKNGAAIAVSGGADSMALAYLFRHVYPKARSDAPGLGKSPKEPIAFIVDHGLRPESSDEAHVVKGYIENKIGMQAEIVTAESLKDDINSTRSNLETSARQARYNLLGLACLRHGIRDLFVAHHADDDYETVFMRKFMQSGTVSLALRDIMPLPVHGTALYGLHNSGDPVELHLLSLGSVHPTITGFEQGSFDLHRPLLHSRKIELVKLLQDNNIPWVEDPTNADVSLTVRNAIRAVDQSHMPLALRHESLLLAARSAADLTLKYQSLAQSMCSERCRLKLDPYIGVLYAQLPTWDFIVNACRTAQLPSPVLAAAHLLRELADFVSPRLTTSVVSFAHLVENVFPECPRTDDTTTWRPEGVTFKAVRVKSGLWPDLDSPSNPHLNPSEYLIITRDTPDPRQLSTNSLFTIAATSAGSSSAQDTPFHFFDNRFWISIKNATPFAIELRFIALHELDELACQVRKGHVRLESPYPSNKFKLIPKDHFGRIQRDQSSLHQLGATKRLIARSGTPVLVYSDWKKTDHGVEARDVSPIIAFPTLGVRVVKASEDKNSLPDNSTKITWRARYKFLAKQMHPSALIVPVTEHTRLAWNSILSSQSSRLSLKLQNLVNHMTSFSKTESHEKKYSRRQPERIVRKLRGKTDLALLLRDANDIATISEYIVWILRKETYAMIKLLGSRDVNALEKAVLNSNDALMNVYTTWLYIKQVALWNLLPNKQVLNGMVPVTNSWPDRNSLPSKPYFIDSEDLVAQEDFSITHSQTITTHQDHILDFSPLLLRGSISRSKPAVLFEDWSSFPTMIETASGECASSRESTQTRGQFLELTDNFEELLKLGEIASAYPAQFVVEQLRLERQRHKNRLKDKKVAMQGLKRSESDTGLELHGLQEPEQVVRKIDSLPDPQSPPLVRRHFMQRDVPRVESTYAKTTPGLTARTTEGSSPHASDPKRESYRSANRKDIPWVSKDVADLLSEDHEQKFSSGQDMDAEINGDAIEALMRVVRDPKGLSGSELRMHNIRAEMLKTITGEGWSVPVMPSVPLPNVSDPLASWDDPEPTKFSWNIPSYKTQRSASKGGRVEPPRQTVVKPSQTLPGSDLDALVRQSMEGPTAKKARRNAAWEKGAIWGVSMDSKAVGREDSALPKDAHAATNRPALNNSTPSWSVIPQVMEARPHGLISKTSQNPALSRPLKPVEQDLFDLDDLSAIIRRAEEASSENLSSGPDTPITGELSGKRNGLISRKFQRVPSSNLTSSRRGSQKH